MRRSPHYWVCVVTRNGASTIGRTLDSILGQTIAPDLIVVVNDGSTDETGSIVRSRKESTLARIQIIDLPNRGYDIRRVPSNINEAYSYASKTGRSYSHSMISGDDCVYPAHYCECLLARMDIDPKLVIASGDWGVKPPPDLAKAPQGAGRIIREDFWKKLGGRYPVAYGWETWVLFKALQMGYRIMNLTELRYQHLRPSGSTHKFAHWGIAMRTLGYHPLMVLVRFAKNILLNAEPISVSGSLSMLAAYLFVRRNSRDPYMKYFETDLRDFVRWQQFNRIRRFIVRIL